MFTGLGNIFSIKPRHAEQTDTRQGIQRHDPEFEQRRESKKEEKDQEFTEDGATISVDALAVFLANFIQNKDQETTNNGAEQRNAQSTPTPAVQENIEQPAVKSAGNPAAQAASMYQTTAQNTEKHDILLETTDQAKGPPLDLSSADIRTIHALIEDLKLLKDARIEYLHIERAATFLDSLVNAVNKVKLAGNL